MTTIAAVEQTAVERELERTGPVFSGKVEKVRDAIARAKAEIERISRQQFPVRLDRVYSTQLEADLAMANAQAAARAPLIAEQRAKINALDFDLRELHEARTREVELIRQRAILGGDVPAFTLAGWETDDYRRLAQQLDGVARETSELEGELVALQQKAERARDGAKETAVLVRMGQQKPAAVETAQRAATEAEAAVSRTRDRLEVLEDVAGRLGAKLETLEQELKGRWLEARRADLKAAARQVVEPLRQAMIANAPFKRLYFALYPSGTGACWVLPALDAENPESAGRRWLEALLKAGWIE